MNNTVEDDFFEFLKLNWLYLTGEMNKSARFSRQFFQDLTHQNY